MKVYSVLFVSVTLFVFYNLAVFQENRNDQKDFHDQRKVCMELPSNQNMYGAEVNSCSSKTKVDLSSTYLESHHVGQDDFALQVSGKDHRYLHTGVTYIPSVKVAKTEKRLRVEITQVDKPVQELTGS